MNGEGKHARLTVGETRKTDATHTAPISSLNSYYQQMNSSANTNPYSRSNYRTPKRPHKKKRIALSILSILVLYTAFMGVTAKLALDDLTTMRTCGNTLAKELFSGNITNTQTTAETFTSKSKHLRRLTNNPLWNIASLTPYIGSNIAVVQEYAVICDELSEVFLNPLISGLQQSETGALVRIDGSFNADSIKIALDTLSNAAPIISKHSETVQNLRMPSIKRIAQLHKQAYRALKGAEQLSYAAPELALSIHYLLGSDGSSRTYLTIAQNNAELRSSGGFIGSYGFLYVDNGNIELGEFQSIWKLGRWGGRDEIVINAGEPNITEEEAALFGRRVAMTPGDATIIPDFPRAAVILRDQVSSLQGTPVDGVISIDPICLQSIISVVGEIITSDGTAVDGSNTVTTLLCDTYSMRTAEEQDYFFSEVAQLAFNKLFDDINSLDFIKLIRATWGMRASRNLIFWVDDLNAEAAFTSLGYAGEISKDLARPSLGIYLNNGAGSKMSWYISEKTSFQELGKLPDGRVEYSVTTTIRNNVSVAEAANLAPYVTGFLGDTPGKMRHWIYLIAPAGGVITNLETNGNAQFHTGGYSEYYASTNGVQGFVETQYNNFNVWYSCIDLMPEEEETITYTVITDPQAQYQLTLDESPILQDIAGW